MRISTNISIVPFAHPLRLAEDLAVLDQLSGGRMEFGVGLGYAPHEFRAFGFPVSHRVSRTEECVDILRLAWSGEPFSYAGKRYRFDDVRVTPDPVQPGGPPLWLAVSSGPSVGRAVRFGTHILPQGPVVVARRRGESRSAAAGGDPTSKRVGIIRSFLVTDDPERDWPPLRAAERYRMAVYGRFFEEAGLGGRARSTSRSGSRSGSFVGDVDHCVAELTAFVAALRAHRRRHVGLGARACQPAALTPSMERFAAEVVPQVRANLAPPRPDNRGRFEQASSTVQLRTREAVRWQSDSPASGRHGRAEPPPTSAGDGELTGANEVARPTSQATRSALAPSSTSSSTATPCSRATSCSARPTRSSSESQVLKPSCAATSPPAS